MSGDFEERIFEERLGKVLRPIAPREGFADRVAARIDAESSPHIHGLKQGQMNAETKRVSRLRAPMLRWFPVALAASAVLSIAVVHQVREREEQRGIEARRQLMEALRVTSDTLDAAYHAVNAEPRSAADDSGA